MTPKHFGIDTWANLSVAVDYFQFKVSNEVQTFGSAAILTQCYQGNSAFCSLFQRDLNPASPSYLNILTVNNNYVNVASQYVNGLDVTIRADHDFGDKGKLSFETNLTWTMTDKKVLLGGSAIQDYNGATYNYDGPDFAGNASLRWDRGNYTVFWNSQFIGKGSDTQLFGGDVFSNSKYANVPAGVLSAQTYYKQYVDARIYHDISVQRRLPSMNVEITLGMRNAFDEAPPSQSTGQFRSGTSALNAYDMIGRQFFGRLQRLVRKVGGVPHGVAVALQALGDEGLELVVVDHLLGDAFQPRQVAQDADGGTQHRVVCGAVRGADGHKLGDGGSGGSQQLRSLGGVACHALEDASVRLQDGCPQLACRAALRCGCGWRLSGSAAHSVRS